MPAAVPAGAMTAPSRRETRALLARVAEAQADADAIVELVSSARAEVVEAYQIAREPQVWTAIGTMSIDTLKDTVDGRARLDELPAHGIYSVADVLHAGSDRLIGVPGIGEGTARKTIHAAEQLKRAARDSLQFRIEFDPKNPDMTRLLRALANWGAVSHAAGAHEADAGRLAVELATQRPIAEPAGTGRLRRLFMRAGDRAVADDAARRVRARLDTAESSGLLRAAQEVRAVRTPSDEQVWRDFEQHSADYYGLLSQVVGLGGDVAASEGYLPADIVERVGAQQLDTSRLSDSLRLRGYQSFGARFALVQRRVVLGDEMGLGKTVQAIATIAHLAARGATHFLVVCSASVLINWAREIARHSTIPVISLHGNGRARAAARWRDLLAVVGAAFGTDACGPITGSTPVADRQRIVDEFTASPKPAVLVCQIEAAGVGVNIQAASVVILCEPQVKPSIEAQAIARAHRMGQVRTVQVHRLLIADSVDERMIEILSSKAQLFDAYVRHSTIARAAPDAVDISEVQLARMIVAQEQQRLAGTAEPPSRLVTSTTSAHSDRVE